MAVPTITYQTLLTKALTDIQNSCTNVTGTIPNEYKSSYSLTETLNGTGGRKVVVTMVTKYASGADNIKQVATSKVSEQFYAYFSDIVSKASQNITTRGLAEFYNKLGSFCSARIFSCSSQMNSTNITVYNASDSITYTTVNTVTENEIITAAQDVTLAIQLISSIRNAATKAYAVKYTRTMTYKKP